MTITNIIRLLLVVAVGFVTTAAQAQVKLKFRFLDGFEMTGEHELRISWVDNGGPTIESFNFDNPPWQLAGKLRNGQDVAIPRVMLEGHYIGISLKVEVFDVKTGQKVAGWDTIPKGHNSRRSFFQGDVMRRDVKETGVYTFLYQGGENIAMEFDWKQEALW